MSFTTKIGRVVGTVPFSQVATHEIVEGCGSGDAYLKIDGEYLYNLTQQSRILGAGMSLRRLAPGTTITLTVA